MVANDFQQYLMKKYIKIFLFSLSELVQACLRAPLVVADEAKLAIVFT